MPKGKGHMIWGTCEYCGKAFIYNLEYRGGRKRKYCCKECYHKAQTLLAKVRRKEALKVKYEPKMNLDDKLFEMRTRGLTPADYGMEQRRKTLELVGRVNV